MGRSFMLAGMIVVVAFAMGCGGRDKPLDTTERAKPTDIGTPDQWPMGTELYKNRIWIVKQDVGGETRMWAIESSVPYFAQSLQFNTKTQVFYGKGRKRRYDINGIALHTVLTGPKKGGDAPDLRRKKLELDRETGHILLYMFGMVPQEEWEERNSGGYIAVP